MAIGDMKAALRKTVQTRLQTLAAQDITSRSAIIQERLLSLDEFKHARRIAIYLSMPAGEVSTSSIVEQALRQGKEVFVPYLHKNPGVSTSGGKHTPKRLMDMVSIESMQDFDSLDRDRWGIPTPSESSIPRRRRVLGDIESESLIRQPLNASLDLIVMPGMAFDRNCNRLGHGKGFYDFFLAEYRASLAKSSSEAVNDVSMPILVALSLPEQLLSAGEIPTESHDHILDKVLTDSETVQRET